MKRAIAGSLVAICVLLFTTALGLALITITDFPYVTDIGVLKISENTGLTREEILLNYHAVISYLSPFSNAEFTLPTLGYTEKASFHFAECKTLFNEVYLVGLVSGLILAFLAIKKAVSKKTLKLSGIITLLIPILLAVALMTDFDRAFYFFPFDIFCGCNLAV